MALEPGRQFDFTGRSPEVTHLGAYREARERLRSSTDPITVANYHENPYGRTQELAKSLADSGEKFAAPKPTLRDQVKGAGGIARYLGLVEDREPGK